MIQIRRSEDRGHANHGWLDSHHTFSFANYHDPKHVHFRSLRVINEDRVAPGQGFGLHPHDNMEILSYVISGALEHRDSMGNRATMRAGEVQRISAGTGIYHSEYNPSATEPVHFLQIWIFPDERGVKPNYLERSFADLPTGKLQLIASKADPHAVPIHQDANVWVGKLQPGEQLTHAFAPGRAGWIQLIEGALKISTTAGEHPLTPGDGVAITDEREIRIQAEEPAHLLLFDLA